MEKGKSIGSGVTPSLKCWKPHGCGIEVGSGLFSVIFSTLSDSDCTVLSPSPAFTTKLPPEEGVHGCKSLAVLAALKAL